MKNRWRCACYSARIGMLDYRIMTKETSISSSLCHVLAIVNDTYLELLLLIQLMLLRRTEMLGKMGYKISLCLGSIRKGKHVIQS